MPLGEQGQPHNPVTEHLARSRHGQVPRIPETLFSFLQEGFPEEELEDDEEVEEVVKVKKKLIGGNSVNHNVDTYRSYSLPPDSVLLSTSQLTTSNPLDNLRDFHKMDREEEDQLAVESLEVTPRAVPAPVSALTTEPTVSALTTEATLEPQHKVPAENMMQQSTQPQEQDRGEQEREEEALQHQELLPRKTQERVLTEEKLIEKMVLEKELEDVLEELEEMELEDVLEELEEMELEEDGWVTSGPSQLATMQEKQEGEMGAPGPDRKEWQAAQGPGAERAAVSEAGQEEVTDPGEQAAGVQKQTGLDQQLTDISQEKPHAEILEQYPSLESLQQKNNSERVLQQENHFEDILELDDPFYRVLQKKNQSPQIPQEENPSREDLKKVIHSQEIQPTKNPSQEVLEQGSRTPELQGIEEGGGDLRYPGPGGSSPAHPQEVMVQTNPLEDPPMQYPVLGGSPGGDEAEAYPQYHGEYTYIEYYQDEAEISEEQQEYLEENSYLDGPGSLEEAPIVTSEKPSDHTYPFALYGGDEEESDTDVYEIVTDPPDIVYEVPSAVTELVTTQKDIVTEKIAVDKIRYEDMQEVAPSLASAPASTSSPAPAPIPAEAPAPVPAFAPAEAPALDTASTPTLTSRPLLTLMTSEPNTMQLLVTPYKFEPETTVGGHHFSLELVFCPGAPHVRESLQKPAPSPQPAHRPRGECREPHVSIASQMPSVSATCHLLYRVENLCQTFNTLDPMMYDVQASVLTSHSSLHLSSTLSFHSSNSLSSLYHQYSPPSTTTCLLPPPPPAPR